MNEYTFDYVERNRLDAFCKTVLRNEAINYLSELARRRDREKSLDTLPEQEQQILILHCVAAMADGEIGGLVGMSRSAVQRHRTKTLNELRQRLEDNGGRKQA